MEKHFKKLEQSRIQLLISKAKGESQAVHKVVKERDNVERLEARKHRFTNLSGASADPALLDAKASQIQSIKKAILFADDQHQENIDKIIS